MASCCFGVVSNEIFFCLDEYFTVFVIVASLCSGVGFEFLIFKVYDRFFYFYFYFHFSALPVYGLRAVEWPTRIGNIRNRMICFVFYVYFSICLVGVGCCCGW